MPAVTSAFATSPCTQYEGHSIRPVHDPDAGATALFCERCGVAEPLSRSPTETDAVAEPTVDDIPF